MENQEDNRRHHHHHHRHSDTEPVGGYAANAYAVEIALDEREASTAVQSVMTAGGGAVVRNDSTRSAVVHALRGLEFISKTDGGATWAQVAERFNKLTSNTNGLLPRSLFGECIGMHKDHDKEFSGKLFDALARRTKISRAAAITKPELKVFWGRITNKSFGCRLEIFFDMIDKDADGRITEDEVREIISSSASSNELSNISNRADEYARLIMEQLDPYNLGYIMVENLERLLLEGGDESQDRSQMPKPAQDNPLKRWYRGFLYFLVDNWQRVWVVALWLGAMAGLFAYKYIQYRDRAAFDVMGHCVCMAKGAAETLKLNMALVLLPTCRNTITWLRNKTMLGAAVPFDDNINFHRVIAVAIAMGVGIHGISHLACDFPRLLNASPEKYEPMEQFFGDQPTSYGHFVKGWAGVTGIAMVVLMAIAFTLASPWFRRNEVKLPKLLKKLTWFNANEVKLQKLLKKLTGFNAFWYSHHLFIIVYILLIIHGIKLYLTHEWYKKTTWMYLAIPIIIYAGERLIRTWRSRIKHVTILEVAVYPENVLALHMSKPDQGFKYKSGQYIFVKCEAVSPFEWHPFSITSAPGDNYLSVHIRSLGDWTTQIRALFSELCQPPETGRNELFRDDILRGKNNPNFPRILIDGPYGAPTQNYMDYEVVLLVGLGIGATPMISVLKDIINNMKAMEEEENALEEGGRAKNGPSPPSSTPMSLLNGRDGFKLRKVYFYWVTKKQGSFEWFKSVMNEVAERDRNRVIEMHSYCTSIHENGDARVALIDLVQSINHAKNRVDIVSGTRVKSHFGKPDWRAVHKGVAFNHPNSRVGVFYCGTASLVKKLRHLASDFSHKTSTKFEFHKENF